MSWFLHDTNIRLDLVAIGPTRDTLSQSHESLNTAATDYSITEVEFLHVTHPSTTYDAIRDAVAHAYRETGINLEGRWIQHRYEHLNEYLAGRQLPMDVRYMIRQRSVLSAMGGLTVFAGQRCN